MFGCLDFKSAKAEAVIGCSFQSNSLIYSRMDSSISPPTSSEWTKLLWFSKLSKISFDVITLKLMKSWIGVAYGLKLYIFVLLFLILMWTLPFSNYSVDPRLFGMSIFCINPWILSFDFHLGFLVGFDKRVLLILLPKNLACMGPPIKIY